MRGWGGRGGAGSRRRGGDGRHGRRDRRAPPPLLVRRRALDDGVDVARPVVPRYLRAGEVRGRQLDHSVEGVDADEVVGDGRVEARLFVRNVSRLGSNA